jgi:hypothetical protein
MLAGTGVWYVTAKDSAVVNGAPAETANQAESPRANSGGAGAETWAGNWVYAPQPEDAADAGPSAPSHSELLLVEEHGKLTGTYRARYRIGDQALPAEVEFRAEGAAPSGNSAKLVWASAGGAKGEVELALRSSDVMKVTWWTTALGPRAGLTSGTATLVRQRVR